MGEVFVLTLSNVLKSLLFVSLGYFLCRSKKLPADTPKVLSTITTIVSRYHSQDTWKADLIFSEDSFELLENILMEAGELSDYVSYEDLVNPSFATNAIQ